MMTKLSDNEHEVLAFLKAFYASYARGASQRNIAIALGFSTIPPARKIIEHLCDLRLVTRLPGSRAKYILPDQASQARREAHMIKCVNVQEREKAYAAILLLRQHGVSVVKAPGGKFHIVNGVPKTGAELQALAQTYSP